MLHPRHLPCLVALAFLALPPASLAQAQPMPPATSVTPDPWPKPLPEGTLTYTIFQPQLDSWDVGGGGFRGGRR